MLIGNPVHPDCPLVSCTSTRNVPATCLPIAIYTLAFCTEPVFVSPCISCVKFLLYAILFERQPQLIHIWPQPPYFEFRIVFAILTKVIFFVITIHLHCSVFHYI